MISAKHDQMYYRGLIIIWMCDMATITKHCGIRIVTMAEGDTIAGLCKPGDIILEEDEAGWWTRFIDEAGQVDSYDAAFDSYNKALWTAKAAAEFQAE